MYKKSKKLHLYLNNTVWFDFCSLVIWAPQTFDFFLKTVIEKEKNKHVSVRRYSLRSLCANGSLASELKLSLCLLLYFWPEVAELKDYMIRQLVLMVNFWPSLPVNAVGVFNMCRQEQGNHLKCLVIKVRGGKAAFFWKSVCVLLRSAIF